MSTLSEPTQQLVVRDVVSRGKAVVRPLVRDDLDGLVALHRAAFGTGAHPEPAVRRLLGEIFFNHPWPDPTLRCLGHFLSDGTLVGAIGVMPRPMTFEGQPIRAMVSHNFMVHPEHRRGLTAINLMRKVFEFEPDLILSEGTEPARRIWESMGGHVVGSRSTRWLRVLRPAGLLAHSASETKLPPALSSAARKMAVLPDAIASLVLGSFRKVPSCCEADNLLVNEGLLVRLIEQDPTDYALRPIYREESLRWIMATLTHSHREQTLRGCTVPGPNGPIGWYLYLSRPGGIARALQLGGDREHREEVLEHMFADAYKAGNVGVIGQGDPVWLDALKASSCFIRPGATWFMYYTRRPELRKVLDTPRAFVSRLEGEGWIRFAC
jgi:hypothetical protein